LDRLELSFLSFLFSQAFDRNDIGDLHLLQSIPLPARGEYLGWKRRA
jgi:hypothetical protein